MFQLIYCLVIYGVVLLLGFVRLKAGSTAVLLMSPGYGGYTTLDTKPQRCLFTTQQPVSSQPAGFHAAAYDAYELHN
jgi:hypothetical protein